MSPNLKEKVEYNPQTFKQMTKEEKNIYQKLLGKWLFTLREEKGLSQESLAIQLEKGQSDIAKIEMGSKKITFVDLLHWMVVLNVSFDRLKEPFFSIFNDLSKTEDLK